jgi:hypothetical protein
VPTTTTTTTSLVGCRLTPAPGCRIACADGFVALAQDLSPCGQRRPPAAYDLAAEAVEVVRKAVADGNGLAAASACEVAQARILRASKAIRRLRGAGRLRPACAKVLKSNLAAWVARLSEVQRVVRTCGAAS